MKRAPGDIVSGTEVTARDGGGAPARVRPFVDSMHPTFAREGEPVETVEVGAAPAADLAPGTVLGKYRVVRRIAGGGMGAVHEAIHTGINKPVALKTMSPMLAADPRSATRFLREAAAASRLDHPHVVDVTDFGTDNGVSYLVMELLRGQDLGGLLSREGESKGLEPSLVADIMLAVCAGVFAAHESGVVHRDLKPQNIFLARTPLGEVVPKVLDFGISKRLDDELEAGLTNSGAVMGTTHYLSPEQVGGKPLDVRSDQYALGVIMYEALTGRRPHEGDSMFAVMQSIGAGRFPLPRLVRPEIPAALEAVILKAMSNLPQDRFESVHELGATLMTFASPKRRIMWSDYYQRGRPPVTPAPGAYSPMPLPAVCHEGGTVALELQHKDPALTPTQTRTPDGGRAWDRLGREDTRNEPGPVAVLGTDEFLRTMPSRGRGARRMLAAAALVAGAVFAYGMWVEPTLLAGWLGRISVVREAPSRATPPISQTPAEGAIVAPRASSPAAAVSAGPAPSAPVVAPAIVPPPPPVEPAAAALSPATSVTDRELGASPATRPLPVPEKVQGRRTRVSGKSPAAFPAAAGSGPRKSDKWQSSSPRRDPSLAAAAAAVAAARKRAAEAEAAAAVNRASPPGAASPSPAAAPNNPPPTAPPPVTPPAPSPAPRAAPINPTGAPIIE